MSSVPIREQEGALTMVRIGAGAWVGSAAVVMADVGANSIIGAGSVVTAPVPDVGDGGRRAGARAAQPRAAAGRRGAGAMSDGAGRRLAADCAAGAAAVTIVESALIERRFGLFRGGFLAPEHLETAGQRVALPAALRVVADLVVVGLLAGITLWLGNRLGLGAVPRRLLALRSGSRRWRWRTCSRISCSPISAARSICR